MEGKEEQKKVRVTKKEYETIKTLKKYRNLKYGLKAGTYATCLVPFGVILGVNWQEWFTKTEEGSISIGVGFGMLLVATISTIVCIMKRDEEFMKKFSPLLYAAVVCAMWAVAFMFLSSIMNEMGKMFMYTAIGIASGAAIDETNRVVVSERYEIISKIAEENGLTKKGEFMKEALKQAKKDAEEKERSEATE